ncbi:MAG: hypothetical protein NVSMB62_21250 [Acidobacteriaceae bacterium]
MNDTEREMLREREEQGFAERRPWDSSRQATYEDTVPQAHDHEEEEAS